MRLVDRAVNSEVYTVGSTGRTGSMPAAQNCRSKWLLSGPAIFP
jgi:hypothetical protein